MDVVIDLNEHKITADWKDETGVVDVLWAHADENGNAPTVTITGNGAMICGKNGDKVCVVSATDGAKITIENGTFTSGGSACIYASRNGEIVIKDGTFSADELYYGVSYLLDINEAEERGTIIVYGGSFKNFDPANHTNDGAGNTNKVADGCHSIKNGDSYVVSKHTSGDAVTENNVDPTCTADGSYDNVIYCNTCGKELSRETITVDAKGHDLVDVEAKAKTCTEDGYTAHKACEDCDYTEGKETIPAGHDLVDVEAKAKTCTEDGYTAHKACEDCDYTEGKETIPAGHDLVDVEAKAKTCTEDGYTAHKACEDCDYTEGKETIPTTGHSFTNYVSDGNATCTEDGTKTAECDNCEETDRIADEGSALGHNLVDAEGKSATCTEDGYTAYKDCSRCEHIEGKEVVKATGHNFVDDECTNNGCHANLRDGKVSFELGTNGSASHNDGTEKTPYIETVNGYTLTISNMSKVYSGARDEKGNSCLKLGTGSTVGSFSFTVPENVTQVIILAAKYKNNDVTVEVNGTPYTLSKNSNDGEYDVIIVDTSVNKTVTFETTSSGYRAMVNTIEFLYSEVYTCEHQYNETRVEATCTTNGSITYTCTKIDCGKTKVEVIEAFGHTEVDDVAIEATCTTAGKTAGKHCSICDEVTVAQTAVPATGHTEGDWIVDTEATEGVDGSRHKECTVCSETLITEVIPALSHVCKYTTVVVTDPTCTEAGYTTYKCGCGESYTEAGEPATGHTEVVDDAVAATCTTAGKTEGKHCSVCSTVLVAQTTVTETGHAWSSWTPNGNNEHSRTCVNNNAHTETANCSGGTATCQEKATCETCGQQYGNLSSHKDNNGTCETCGKKIVYTWTEVKLADIKSDDVIIIVWKNSSGTYAITNTNGTGSAPSAVKITVSGDKLTTEPADNLKWNISYSGGNLTIYPNGTTSKWLYCTSTNNGVRVGTNTNKTFTIDTSSGYLKHTGTGRYLGIYNSQDARCYTSVNDNIKGQTLVFFKLTASVTDDNTPVCEHTNKTTTTTATCTKAGVETVTCKDCGKTVSTENVDALGHNYVDGTCSRCGEADPNQGGSTEPTEPELLATFTLGANGSASHADGSEKTSYSETNNGYTLTLSGMSKVYGSARDAKGNSCLKLGTGSAAGKFSFTVAADVTEVKIYVAKYKSNTSKVTINGTTYTLTKNSDNGEYDVITIDTTTTKTISITTISGGYRAMVNTIEFIGYPN